MCTCKLLTKFFPANNQSKIVYLVSILFILICHLNLRRNFRYVFNDVGTGTKAKVLRGHCYRGTGVNRLTMKLPQMVVVSTLFELMH